MKHNYEKVPGDEPADDVTPVTEDNVEIQKPTADPAKPPQGETNAWRMPPGAEYNQQRDGQCDFEDPDITAPVHVVRAYIVAVLHSAYDVPRDEADATAEKWQGKLGRQFLALKSKKKFEREFGETHGAMLWEYRRARKAKLWYNILSIVVPVMAFFLLIFTPAILQSWGFI